jgi:ankyrin repeat protein
MDDDAHIDLLTTSADFDSFRQRSMERMVAEHERSPAVSVSKRARKKKRVSKSSGSSKKSQSPTVSIDVSMVTDPEECADSPFHVACATGDEGFLQMTLDANQAVVDHCDEDRRTPLGIAARCGHASCIRLLLEKGANANNPDRRGCFPLHLASEIGFENCVEILLDHEVFVDAVDGERFTPLHLPCEQGHSPFVKLFTKKKVPWMWQTLNCGDPYILQLRMGTLIASND